jgi:WD40 repeat protein
MLIKVALAVHHAHQHGILHRDLKPGNILLDDQREPYVADFGLAKSTGSDNGLTITGVPLGTPSYISPEQASGQKGVTTATDVYSLGAILFELLTGRPPFRGETVMHTVRDVIEQDPPAPRSIAPWVERDLESICLKCLEKSPTRRYVSAEALVDDLRNWLEKRPIRARRQSVPERWLLWARRQPAFAALIALVVLLAAVGFPGALFLWRRAEGARKAEVRLREQLESTLYFQRIGVVERDLTLNHLNRVEDLLDQCLPVGLRGWEWHYLRRWLYRDSFQSIRCSNIPVAVAYSRDGRFLACTLDDQSTAIYDGQAHPAAPSQLPLAKIPGQGRVATALAFGNEDCLALSGQDSTVTLWQLSKGLNNLDQTRRILACKPGLVWGIGFSPDGKRLCACFDDGSATLWDLRGDPVTSTTWSPHDKRAVGVAFSPDGTLIATASYDGTVALTDSTRLQVIRRLSGHFGPVTSVAFSPDGTRLASTGIDMTVRVWDPRAGQELRRLRGHNGTTLAVAFSPDGARLVSSSMDQTMKVWDTTNYSDILTLRGHDEWVTSLAYSPDGYRLASCSMDRSIKIWDGAPVGESDRQDLLTFQGHRAMNYGVAFSPDSKQVASTSADATAKLWDAENGRELFVFRDHQSPVLSVSFSPDGALVATSGGDATTRVWESGSGRAVSVLRSSAEVCCCKFSPNGRLLATSDQKGLIKIWNAGTWKESRTLSGHDHFVWGLSFSNDGRQLASGSFDGTTRIWDVSSGRQLQVLNCRSAVRSVDFHPLAYRVASGGSDRVLRIWDSSTGRELSQVGKHTSGVTSVKFSADGRLLASGTDDGGIKLFDADTGREMHVFRGHTARIHGLSFDSRSHRLASSSSDNTVRIWIVSP